MTGIH